MTRACGALLLLFDVAEGAIVEHDDWHTREHLPERLAIPGFRRGTRWVADAGSPRYCVIYDVDEPAVLTSPAYREHLDRPTPWTAAIMKAYLGMRRTLCRVVAGEGEVVGGHALVIAHAPQSGRADALRYRLVGETMPAIAAMSGVASWRLYENAIPAPMTQEQSIRGRDASVPAALVVTGHDAAALDGIIGTALAADWWMSAGAAWAEPVMFRLACTIAAAG
ncbi:MAG: hypothetical protein IT518_27010 [Burkholderiales bacterium]|nr:hypothetical protein [Burkholderiales bacterium]